MGPGSVRSPNLLNIIDPGARIGSFAAAAEN